jgi:hypothetical protein
VGWNQTAADWAMFVRYGRALGLFEAGEHLVATAASLPYDAGFGWVSMVIVAPEWRRRGLARRLMAESIDTLSRRGCHVLLDATPAGAEVYTWLGFIEVGRMDRWQGEGSGASDIPELAGGESDQLIRADQIAFGAERGFLLRDFLSRAGARALAMDGAYLVIRPGHRATHLGPLVAGSATAARRLIERAVDGTHGPLFLDLLEPWQQDIAPLLEARGFRRQRPFRRMALGRTNLPGDPAQLVLAAGPEFG